MKMQTIAVLAVALITATLSLNSCGVPKDLTLKNKQGSYHFVEKEDGSLVLSVDDSGK